MSYSETYHAVVSGSKVVSYPSSQNGGSMTVYVDVPVTVYINVDTDPFDSSVLGCNTAVAALTASVVATELAEVQSKEQNSRKIASTIVTGFFKYTRSEISQQSSELASKIDATLIHLRQMSETVSAKKVQLLSDFNRIAERYQKLFQDLDNELRTRIAALDKPVFQFVRQIADSKTKYFGNGSVNMATVFQKENGGLLTMILSSRVKSLAQATIGNCRDFILQQARMEHNIRKNSHASEATGEYGFPVCYMESVQPSGETHAEVFHIYQAGKRPVGLNDTDLVNRFSPSATRWSAPAEEEKAEIRRYLLQMLAARRASGLPSEDRIADTAQMLFENSDLSKLENFTHERA